MKYKAKNVTLENVLVEFGMEEGSAATSKAPEPGHKAAKFLEESGFSELVELVDLGRIPPPDRNKQGGAAQFWWKRSEEASGQLDQLRGLIWWIGVMGKSELPGETVEAAKKRRNVEDGKVRIPDVRKEQSKEGGGTVKTKAEIEIEGKSRFCMRVDWARIYAKAGVGAVAEVKRQAQKKREDKNLRAALKAAQKKSKEGAEKVATGVSGASFSSVASAASFEEDQNPPAARKRSRGRPKKQPQPSMGGPPQPSMGGGGSSSGPGGPSGSSTAALLAPPAPKPSPKRKALQDVDAGEDASDDSSSDSSIDSDARQTNLLRRNESRKQAQIDETRFFMRMKTKRFQPGLKQKIKAKVWGIDEQGEGGGAGLQGAGVAKWALQDRAYKVRRTGGFFVWGQKTGLCVYIDVSLANGTLPTVYGHGYIAFCRDSGTVFIKNGQVCL